MSGYLCPLSKSGIRLLKNTHVSLNRLSFPITAFLICMQYVSLDISMQIITSMAHQGWAAVLSCALTQMAHACTTL
jgi:hypothetical protein